MKKATNKKTLFLKAVYTKNVELVSVYIFTIKLWMLLRSIIK